MDLREVCDYLLVFWEVLLICCNGLMTLIRQLMTTPCVPQDLISRKGQVAIVTGGNRGIGLEVVKRLMQHGMHVIIACRFPEEGEKLKGELSEKYPDGKVDVMKLDLASFESIQQFAEAFLATDLPIHLLINNAGIMIAPFEKTSDGFESHFGVNYLGHFLLTLLLLPRLKQTSSSNQFARIVNVSSCVALAGNIKFESFRNKLIYSPHISYAQSKLAQMMFALSLQDRLIEDGAFVTVSSLHPGVIYSDLFRRLWMRTLLAPFLKMMLQTPSHGAATILYAASSPSVEGVGGQYFLNCRAEGLPAIALDKKLRKKLWDASHQLVGDFLKGQK